MAKIKEVTKAIREPQGDKAENRPATPPTEGKKEKINRIGQRAWQVNYNPINRQGHRPEGFSITINNEALITPRFKERTMVMLATATKSIKLFKGSTYNNILANTTVAEMARNQGWATRWQIPAEIGQPYIIATIPPAQAGENEVAPEALFKTLAIIRKKLE